MCLPDLHMISEVCDHSVSLVFNQKIYAGVTYKTMKMSGKKCKICWDTLAFVFN